MADPEPETHSVSGVRTRPETALLGAWLAAAGGFLDAYTYVGHGGVFANAQTGNVVLGAVAAAAGHWTRLLSYVLPILAFAAGVIGVEVLSRPGSRRLLRRPTRVVLVLEILVLAILGVTPGLSDHVVAGAVSFVAALQISTFHSIQGKRYSTALATANLRTMVTNAYRSLAERDKDAARSAVLYAGVVTAFACGAAGGALATARWRSSAALIPAAMFAVAIWVIALETSRLAQEIRPTDRS